MAPGTLNSILKQARLKPCPALFDDDEIFHGFSLACIRILLSVPGAKSSAGFPAMVTNPASWGA